MGKVGIVDCIFRVSAKIVNTMAKFIKKNFELLLHLETTVVCANRNQLRSP